jgi:hypothetical protein
MLSLSLSQTRCLDERAKPSRAGEPGVRGEEDASTRLPE